ncbi:hypothetical protein [Maioricimonas rarisocia]|uniref:hypothetical protein n=1 Tax=Maioricimonas rarisocia TaxID=2528026 RepID=UPI0011A076FA|nr:hypothetical protein [Maioricimonas rarisocia]
MSDATPPIETSKTAEAPAAENDRQQTARAISLWLLLGSIGVFVLSVAAGFAPAPIKRLLLFYLAFGLIAGGGLGRLAQEVGARHSMLIVLLGNLLLLAGGMNVARVSYDRIHADVQERVRQNPDNMLGLKLLEQTAGDDPEMQARVRAEQARLNPRFRDYLRHRVSPLGKWERPWPLVFWIVELALSLAVGTWGMLRTMQRPTSS